MGAGCLLLGLGMSQVSFQLLEVGNLALAYVVLWLFNAVGVVGFTVMVYKALRNV